MINVDTSSLRVQKMVLLCCFEEYLKPNCEQDSNHYSNLKYLTLNPVSVALIHIKKS